MIQTITNSNDDKETSALLRCFHTWIVRPAVCNYSICDMLDLQQKLFLGRQFFFVAVALVFLDAPALIVRMPLVVALVVRIPIMRKRRGQLVFVVWFLDELCFYFIKKAALYRIALLLYKRCQVIVLRWPWVDPSCGGCDAVSGFNNGSGTQHQRTLRLRYLRCSGCNGWTRSQTFTFGVEKLRDLLERAQRRQIFSSLWFGQGWCYA